jgi:arylsulfatase A-like enzyme
MKRNIILLTCIVFVAGAVSAASEKPNILFIMSDDHTSQAVGVYGGRLAALNPTPTIDLIANGGVVMQNAFCHNAICTPSRACIMTGQYSSVNGCTTLNDALPPEKQYLSLEMKKAGYQTAVIGKWHLHARPSSFEYFKVLPEQGFYFDPIFYETGQQGRVERIHPYNPEETLVYEPDAVQMKGHSTDCITDAAIEWLEEKRDPHQPFFLKLHFKAPHDYFEYAPRYDDYLSDVTIPEAENMWERKNNGSIATRGYEDELIHYIGTSVGRRNRRRNYAENPRTPWADKVDHSLGDKEIKRQVYQEYMKAYLRCVKGVDDNVKRVVDYLKAEGLYDDTVIIYTGDQGFYLGEHDFIDKRWGYEEAMRMPLIVRYPKSISAGSRTDAIVENVDFAPTMLDFADLPTPDYMQGRSFREIIETGNEPSDWKKAAYYHYQMHMAHHDNPAHIAIRTKRYKLMLFYGSGWKGEAEPDTPPAWELYDLKLDPTEDNNLYDNPEYAGVIAELKDELKALRKQYKVDGPEFACNKVINEFWDYDDEDRAKAVAISKRLAEQVNQGEWPHAPNLKAAKEYAEKFRKQNEGKR